MLKIHFSQNDMRNMMLIQQTLIQYLLQKKNLCEIFKVLTIWGNINLFIRPQHHTIKSSILAGNSFYLLIVWNFYDSIGSDSLRNSNQVT